MGENEHGRGRKGRAGLWWRLGGGAIALLGFAWVISRLDHEGLWRVITGARPAFLLLVILAIGFEQWVRAWKWRQILYDLRPLGTWRLFGVIMAGYFVNTLIPLGISPLVRAWLLAKLEALKTGALLATVVIDRLVDGLAFAVIVAALLGLAAFPDSSGDIRAGFVVGGLGSFVLFAALLAGLAYLKRRAERSGALPPGLLRRLPGRLAVSAEALATSFAEGILWPRRTARGVAIVLASFAMKLIAATHFLWAGLAFGVMLRPSDYVFLLVFLGFLLILTRLARVPGGFFLGALFALNLLGVAQEPAFAMVLVVQVATLVTVSAVGAAALWRHGAALNEMRLATQGAAPDS